MRTRPGPRAVDGVGEGKALGKRRGLREDRRLRVRALQSGVWGGGGNCSRCRWRSAQAPRAGLWGPGTRSGRFFLYHFLFWPHAQAHFSCPGLVGGWGRGHRVSGERVGGSLFPCLSGVFCLIAI